MDAPEEAAPVQKSPKYKNPPCQGTKKDGSPCRFPAQKNGWCFPHDPGKTEVRRRLALMHTYIPRKKKKSYKTREEVLSMLSERLDIFLSKFSGRIEIPEGASINDTIRIIEGVSKVEYTVCTLVASMTKVMELQLPNDDIKGWKPKPIYERVDAPKPAATG